jgi:hypothetical protein
VLVERWQRGLDARHPADVLMVEFLCPPAPYKAPTALYDVLKHLGLTSSLTWLVDAGDAASNTMGQTMGQIPGGAPSIFLGNDATTDSLRDPTPVGVTGRQSIGEYWSSTCSNSASAANRLGIADGAWMQNMHKDNALFTFAGVFQRDNTDGAVIFASYATAIGAIGIDIGVSQSISGLGADHPAIDVGNGSGTAWASQAGAAALTVARNTPFFYGLALDEAAGTALFQVNGSQATVSGTYTSPSAGSAGFPLGVLQGPRAQVTGSTALIFNSAHWTRALSATELMNLYTAQKVKFGI